MEPKNESFSHAGRKEILKRLHFLSGQIGGIEKMIDDERTAKEVYTQLRAAENALHSLIYDVLDRQIKSRFIEVLADRLQRCPGDCNDHERLQFLKNGLSDLNLKELIDELTWLGTPSDAATSTIEKKRKEVKDR